MESATGHLAAIMRDGNAAAPPTGGVLKRGFDVSITMFAIVLLSPLLVMLALLVKCSDRGSVFYAHPRIGRNGKTFKCLKFRTMVEDGNAALLAHFAKFPEDKEEWKQARKLRFDPRVTRVGLVLRRLSLDELPQLWNVLRGEMSLVGPRPVVLDELVLYGRTAPVYLRSRPGLTGLWQVNGRNDVSYRRRVAFDRAYVENWSLGFDLKIIALTVPAVLSARGSY
jgi:exopolysaccharide production protein ExoY